ncbi:hypothetical protein MTO96_014030 [Rhipicephalus appendiculatus]
MDSFLFLLASFYGTASPVPRKRVAPFTRTLVCSVWFLAILPLSSYYRSQLVSQLSVRFQVDLIDTLDELDDALSRNAITPCLRTGTMTHNSVLKNHSYTNLHAKLSAALYAAKDRASLENANAAQCLACAEQKDHVCFTDRLSRCLQKMTRGFVESRDTLSSVFTGMFVRKGFAFKVAFRRMMRTMYEAGLFSEKISCLSQTTNGSLHAVLQKQDQLAVLGRFLVVFVFFLATCGTVLVLELIIIGKL